MAALTDTEENRLVDAVCGVAAYGAPVTPLRLRLMTANGTDAAAGTEVTGGSYAAQNVAFAAASGGATSNSGAVEFAGMPAVTVVGVEVWDSAATPRRLWHRALTTNRTVAAGDSIRFPAGALTFSMD